MLETAEIGQTLSKQAFAAREPELRLALVNAQYDLQSTRSRAIVLIAGDDRPGATAVFNRLHEWMDARYLNSHAFGQSIDVVLRLVGIAHRRPIDLGTRFWIQLVKVQQRLGMHLDVGVDDEFLARQTDALIGNRLTSGWIMR